MEHRHLNHANYTLAAIDDVIERGTRVDWIALRDAARMNVAVSSRIERICVARAQERTAQRHGFWLLYVQQLAAGLGRGP